jgi:hypothetical protein
VSAERDDAPGSRPGAIVSPREGVAGKPTAELLAWRLFKASFRVLEAERRDGRSELRLDLLEVRAIVDRLLVEVEP